MSVDYCCGVSQWCGIGKHGNCAHRVGGVQEAGVWLPECYLTAPQGNRRVVCRPNWPGGGSYAMVVHPSHRWRCGCDCHQVGQAPLFGIPA